MFRTVLASILTVAGGLAACAPTAPSAGEAAAPAAARAPQQCFHGSNITGWRDQTDRIVNLRVGVNDVYQLELMIDCPDIRWNQNIALVSQNGSNFICSGIDAEIVTHASIGPHRCPVTNLHKLTPAEIAALPKRAVP